MAKSNKSGSQVIQGGMNINIKGNATIKGSKIAGRDDVEKNVTNVNISFAPVYHALKENATVPPKTKIKIEASVKEIEKEVKKGEAAKVSFIQQRLENIEKMAPDIADVVIATLQNPVTGISVALRKVLGKVRSAKAE